MFISINNIKISKIIDRINIKLLSLDLPLENKNKILPKAISQKGNIGKYLKV